MKEYTEEEIEARRKARRVGRGSKLTPKQWAEIRTKYECGYPLKPIAEKFGIKPQTISAYACRHKWEPHGSMREEAIERARMSVEKKLVKSFEDITKEVNEKHLNDFKASSAACRALLSCVIEKIQWAKEETARRKAQALAEGKPIPAPISVSKEAYTLQAVVNSLRTCIIEGERFILGLKEGIVDADQNDGIKKMTQMLEEARREYEGTTPSEFGEADEAGGD